MAAMNGNAYKLLGFAVWQGGKWYLRRRLPSARRIVLTGLAAGAGLTAVAVLVRRAGA
jgi:hypothetical protein